MLVIAKLYSDSSVKYEGMQDIDIVEIARNGDSLALDYLINKYRKFVIAKSMPYFLVGAEREDIIQEGMIGLFQAIRDYDEGKLTPFIYFVEMCIKRQIITAIKTATRKKHIPLNSYISLNKSFYQEESHRTLFETIEGREIEDPMEVFINEEEFEKMQKKMAAMLSELEFTVLKTYLQGKSYEEISWEIGRDEKCIDNALQRIKRKFGRDLLK